MILFLLFVFCCIYIRINVLNGKTILQSLVSLFFLSAGVGVGIMLAHLFD